MTFSGGFAAAGTALVRGGFSLADALLFEINASAIGFATNKVFDSAVNLFNPTSTFDTGGLNFGLDLSIDTNTNFGSVGGFSAGGGFVLYPNKPNNNMMRQVYSK